MSTKKRVKDASIQSGIKVAPGLVASIFGFFRSLIQGKDARESARTMGEGIIDSADTVASDVVDALDKPDNAA